MRQHVLEGGEVLPPDALAHAESCLACDALRHDAGRAGHAVRTAQEAAPVAALALLESRLETEVARERGVLGRLRALGRPSRLALVLAFIVVEVIALLVWRPRADLSSAPLMQLGATLGLFAVLLVLAIWYALRPIYLPPARAWIERSLVVGAALAPLAITMMPSDAPLPLGSALLTGTTKCLGLGLALGAALLVVARSVDRGGRFALLAAAGAGLAANLALDLHCASVDAQHVVFGHAGVVVVLITIYAIIARRAD